MELLITAGTIWIAAAAAFTYAVGHTARDESPFDLEYPSRVLQSRP